MKGLNVLPAKDEKCYSKHGYSDADDIYDSNTFSKKHDGEEKDNDGDGGDNEGYLRRRTVLQSDCFKAEVESRLENCDKEQRLDVFPCEGGEACPHEQESEKN